MAKRKNILISIVAALKELLHLYQILLAQKRAETNPGYSKIISRIREVAKTMGVDPDLAVRVAWCESGLDNKVMRINKTGSIDRGLFQWNDYWHPEISNFCAFNIECSTRAFCKAVKEDHLSWWNASKTCWDKV